MATAGELGGVSAEAEAFRKCSELLYNGIENFESLAWSCFSKGMISSETRNKVINRNFARDEKASVLLEAIESKIKVSPESFYQLVDMLSNELKRKLIDSVTKCGLQLRGTQSILFITLLDKLHKLKSLDDGVDVETHEHTAALRKKAVEVYVKESFEQKDSLDEIKKSLHQLHLLLSDSELRWFIGYAEDLAKSMSVSTGKEYIHGSVPDKKSLFNKEVIYHASLCCLLVNATSRRDTLSEHNRHLLEEISISKLKEGQVDQYLIARHGKTYYVAFKGELILDKWVKFKSFEEGLFIQSSRIPVRFFIEQLNNGCNVVLTGFSYGGLLACSVTTRLFQEPYLTSEKLAGSLVCITFGQPLISISEIEKTALQNPLLKSVLHCIFTEDDIFPQLMKCTELEICPSSDDTASSDQQTKDPISSDLFKQLSEMQAIFLQESVNVSSTRQASLTECVETLKKLKSQSEAVNIELLPDSSVKLPAENVYEICNERLEFKKLHVSQVSDFFDPSKIKGFSFDFFANHSMVVYHQQIMRGFLECTPVYLLPQPQMNDIKEIGILKPSVDSVSFHRHGKELAVVIAGNNLWFCYNVKVGSLKSVETEARGNTCRSINFNYTPQSESDFLTEDTTSVKLFSHFSNPIRRPAIKVTKKVYEFTFRQEQLAKLTPSELINLAYMSSLLEKHPFDNNLQLSNRFKVLRKFLEEIGSVVPLESILYAIASSDAELAIACCKTIFNSGITIPPSILAIAGSDRALARLTKSDSTSILKSGLYNRELMLTHLSLEHQTNMFQAPESGSPTDMLVAESTSSESELDQSTKQKATKSKKSQRYDVKLVQLETVGTMQLGSSLSVESSEPELNSPFAEIRYLAIMRKEAYLKRKEFGIQVICGLSIELLYPITKPAMKSGLLSPIQILMEGREYLKQLSCASLRTDLQQESSSGLYNTQMLDYINSIRSGPLLICTTLLGAFMEEQMHIPFKDSSHISAKTITSLISKAAVGVWFLFNLALPNLNDLLQSFQGYELLVQVRDYIKGIFSDNKDKTAKRYEGKLQFMVQGMETTVSCNSHYISYSLERQLVALCDDLDISADTPTKKLVDEWDILFKKDVLSLVDPAYRPLVARWMRWALMIHNLREELAKYTAVGVVGLVNSGKSRLVSCLNIQIPVGTTEYKRTTVPFLYNLDGTVDGLDVIDFPGVDDRDETIPDLADLLLSLAQVVIFVVDYRRIHTVQAKKWLDRLEADPVQVLVCLTFADQLYVEHMNDDGTHPPLEVVRVEIATQLSMIKEKLGNCPTRTVNFFSFSQGKDSVLNSVEGRKILKDVGIGDPMDVGKWLVDTFRKHLDQEELATRFDKYVQKLQIENETPPETTE